CYVIAEAGVNHNCDLALGRRLVETAFSAGVDAIKFQNYTASRISTRVAPRYWFEPADPGGTQWDTFDKLDKLSEADFQLLLEHLMRAFPGVPVGLSDHSLGLSVPLAAVALGASMIEKHYTVDKRLPGSPDHHLSVDPPEMKAMVEGIRTVEKALGKAVKGVEPLEEEAHRFARRSVTSKTAIPKGTAVTRAMLTYKRPGTGIDPRQLDLVVGRIARVDI